jgi:hypothetical protein
MKNYLEPFFSKCESVIDWIVYQVDEGMDAISKVPNYLLEKYNGVIENIDEQFYDRLNKETSLARLMRFGSLPWSVIIPKGYKYFISNQYGKALLFKDGVHMIRAKVGGGKSLASFILAEIYLEETGLGSYFTSPVEKPSVTEDGEWLYVFHRVINTNDYYKKGHKVQNYNTKKYKTMHKDERHLEYNPRLNNRSDYNDKFIPEQKDEILMRHEGFDHIYKYSQYMKLDSQDMDALTYMHDVETVKDIPIQRWLDTGELNFIPVVLKFTTFQIEIAFDGGMKRKKVGSCKIPVPYELLERFDTHAERYRNAGLPVDYK